MFLLFIPFRFLWKMLNWNGGVRDTNINKRWSWNPDLLYRITAGFLVFERISLTSFWRMSVCEVHSFPTLKNSTRCIFISSIFYYWSVRWCHMNLLEDLSIGLEYQAIQLRFFIGQLDKICQYWLLQTALTFWETQVYLDILQVVRRSVLRV